MSEDNTQEIEVKEHTNFRTINVTGVIGSSLAMRFEMILFSDHIDTSKGILSNEKFLLKLNRTLQCRLVMDPQSAKLIAQWLNGQINAFEKQYGIIPIGQEQQQNNQSNTQTNKNTTNGVG